MHGVLVYQVLKGKENLRKKLYTLKRLAQATEKRKEKSHSYDNHSDILFNAVVPNFANE